MGSQQPSGSNSPSHQPSKPQQEVISEITPETLQPFTDNFLAAITNVVKLSNSSIFNPQELPFLKASHPEFRDNVSNMSSQVLEMCNRLVKYAAMGTGTEATRFGDVDDVVDRYDGVVDVVDNLLEKAVGSLLLFLLILLTKMDSNFLF